MSNEHIIDAIIESLENEIAFGRLGIKNAILELEKMNSPAKNYRLANELLAINSYCIAYLSHIKDVAEARKIKNLENLIRFHAYRQGRDGGECDFPIKAAQRAVTGILEDIIKRYFDA